MKLGFLTVPFGDRPLEWGYDEELVIRSFHVALDVLRPHVA